MKCIIALFAVMLLTACASFNTVISEKPREVLAAAEISFAGAVVTTEALYRTGAINKYDLGIIVNKLDKANQLLGQAQFLIVTSPAGSPQLSGTIDTLTEVIRIVFEISVELDRMKNAGERL